MDEKQKVVLADLVRGHVSETFKEAAVRFEANSGGARWTDLEDAMWAIQASDQMSAEALAIIADTVPITKWVKELRTCWEGNTGVSRAVDAAVDAMEPQA